MPSLQVTVRGHKSQYTSDKRRTSLLSGRATLAVAGTDVIMDGSESSVSETAEEADIVGTGSMVVGES